MINNNSNNSNNSNTFVQQHFVSDIDELGLGAIDAVLEGGVPASFLTEVWKKLRVRPLFWFSISIITIVLILALFPQVLTSQDPTYCELSHSLGEAEVGHVFGFDRQGCDIFVRTIYGARASITVGLFATITAVIIGGIIGAVAGYYGGIYDSILSRITDIFFAIPLVLAAIVGMQMFKEYRSVFLVVLILGVFGWTQVARIMRSSVLVVKNQEYVLAARSLGLSKAKILWRHVIPNAIAPVIVYASVALGGFIVVEATLSFMGIGLPPSVISWGADIAKAQATLRMKPMILLYPSFALAATVLSFILLGDIVKDALDPKGRK